MRKTKIIFIGAIDIGNLATNGETMKNQLLLRRFEDIYDKVVVVDVNNWRRRPWCFFLLLWELIMNNGTPVVISASAASSLLYSFLYYIPLKKNVNDWVIGGAFPQKIREGIYNYKSLVKLNRIIVEGKGMVRELQEMGFTNVVHVPNFKPIEYSPNISKKGKFDAFRFVFLSRVHPDKGIREIVEASKELQSLGYSNKFIVDFYGVIEKSFEEEFHRIISKDKHLHYRGYLNLMNRTGYDTLSNYDTMLFPTFWNGEGFPGIVIDAYIAGIPIIASNWNMNKEVIIDNKTGFLIQTHDSHSLAVKMKSIIDGDIDLFTMKCQCAAYAKQYDYRLVITKDLLINLNLI